MRSWILPDALESVQVSEETIPGNGYWLVVVEDFIQMEQERKI
jgi:hypothetical protein